MSNAATIAIIDDERNIRTSLRRALEAEGYKVRDFGDTASAFEALDADPPDLMILDGYNPPHHGAGLYKKLHRTRAIPTIFLAAHPEAIQDELNAAGLEADDYLHKPFSMILVINRVKLILGRRQT